MFLLRKFVQQCADVCVSESSYVWVDACLSTCLQIHKCHRVCLLVLPRLGFAPPKNTWRANAKKKTRYILLSLCGVQWRSCQTRSQTSTSAPEDKEACASQIAERHVTVARSDVRSAVCDQPKVNVPPKDLGSAKISHCNKATRFAASASKHR